ncbi:VENN motif pre-toxin domain-containing protein [Neisseria dentiae]|uniref:VENN motif pre-toxin domain-containing protein n=1 Tax=Neisseria dentiae TaxID=194197 RepID=UPI00359C3634
MSGSVSGERLGQNQSMGGVNLYDASAATESGAANGSREGYGQSIGFGRDGDSRSSLTKSGIGTSSLTIGNDTTGEQAKAVYTAIRSETAEQNTGRLNDTFDKDRVQKELDIRREVTQQFGQNVQYANTEINKRLDSLKEQLETGRISQRDYDRRLANWQYGKLALNSLAAGLSAPSESGLGIASAAASPAAAYAVGQYFKGLAQENLLGGKTEAAELTAAQETARAVAHGIIAAATAAAGDHNALTAAISAGGAEAAIPYVSEWLYGTRDAEKLSAEQKTVLGNIAQLAGTGVGLASGGSGVEAVSDGLRARNAVENNYLTEGLKQTPQSISTFDKEMQICKAKGNDCSDIVKKFLEYSNRNRAYLLKECKGGGITCPSYQEIIAANTGESFLASIKDPDVRRIVATVNAADLIFLDKEVGTWSKVGNAVVDPAVIATLIGTRGKGSAISLKEVAKGSTLSAGNSMLYNLAAQWAEKGSIDYRDLVASGIVGGITGTATANTTVVNAKKSGNSNRPHNPYGVPVPEVVKASNGLLYQSNIKHSGRGVGSRPGHVASIEPPNSLQMFEKSVPIANINSKMRYYFDGEVVHQYALSNGTYHWAGVKGKQQANQIPREIKVHFGINVKKLKDIGGS